VAEDDFEIVVVVEDDDDAFRVEGEPREGAVPQRPGAEGGSASPPAHGGGPSN